MKVLIYLNIVRIYKLQIIKRENQAVGAAIIIFGSDSGAPQLMTAVKWLHMSSKCPSMGALHVESYEVYSAQTLCGLDVVIWENTLIS